LGAASGQTTTGKDSKIGTRVTITGCRHEGKARNTFVLLGVTERPADECRLDEVCSAEECSFFEARSLKKSSRPFQPFHPHFEHR